MTATPLAKAKKALRVRPILGEVMRVVIPETGEEVGAWVPLHEVDRRSMRENRYTVGAELRAVFKRARNRKFWGKAHLLGGWLADHVTGFEGLGQHSALKKLQELSGVGCVEEAFEFDAFGQTFSGTRNVAESLNFDDMDEGAFNEFWNGWLDWLRLKKWPSLDPMDRDEVEELVRAPWEQA